MTKDEVAARKFEVRATVADHFAWLQARLSVEGTLMSALRSTTGLIGFGFTIVQVIEGLQNRSPAKPVLAPDMPHVLALALIGAGIIGLAFGIRQYRKFVRYLQGDQFKAIAGISEKPVGTSLVVLAILVEFVGIIAFLTVLFRLS